MRVKPLRRWKLNRRRRRGTRSRHYGKKRNHGRTNYGGFGISSKNVGVQVGETDKEIENLQGDVAVAERILSATSSHECPWCEKGLSVEAGDIRQWKPPTAEEITRAESVKAASISRAAELGGIRKEFVVSHNKTKQKAADTGREIQNLNGQIALLEQQSAMADAEPVDAATVQSERQSCLDAINETQGQIATINALNREISGLVGEGTVLRKAAVLADAEPTEVDADARAAAENAVQNADRRLAAWKSMDAATKANSNVVEYEHLCRLLGPEGVRNKHVIEKLEKVNGILDKVMQITGWPRYRITPSYEILINGRPSSLPNSESAKLRGQWAIQLAFAVMQNAKWLVFDRCDVLRDDAWDGLLKLAAYWTERNLTTYLVLCSTSPPLLPGDFKVISTDTVA